MKVDDDDLELEEVVDSEEPLVENVAEVLESMDLHQALFESAKRVTHTCMDIRRGENTSAWIHASARGLARLGAYMTGKGTFEG